MLDSISIGSFAKINLSLDVGAPMPNGMHPVDTIMQLVSMMDIVSIERAMPEEGIAASVEDVEILITCEHPRVPTDETNLAYKAAKVFLEEAVEKKNFKDLPKRLLIDIEKNIPVEAGLAGGSGNGAAVLVGLNDLLGIGFSATSLCKMGEKLGSDVPFCVNGICCERGYPDSFLSYAVRATGTGTETYACKPLPLYVVTATPHKGMSTREVYEGFDKCNVVKRPNNGKLIEAMEQKDFQGAAEEMINVLELYTLEARPDVKRLKEVMTEIGEGALKVLMSGSGPTVFALFESRKDAIFAEVRIRNAISSEENMAVIGPCDVILGETLCDDEWE